MDNCFHTRMALGVDNRFGRYYNIITIGNTSVSIFGRSYDLETIIILGIMLALAAAAIIILKLRS